MSAVPVAQSSTGTLRQVLNKVPEVTLAFWLIKMMSTTVGETAADSLNASFHLGLTGTSLVMSALFAIALFFQVRSRRYVPALYWLTVVLVSVVGTLVTDNLTDHLGIPLAWSTGVFGLALVTVFSIWEPVIIFVCEAYHDQQEHVCQARRNSRPSCRPSPLS